MIKAEELEIKEFRGIRKLKLNLKGSNFAVCGPNGTGKSGIVDALEFILTGNISRLSGRGTGELSIKEHAPHVDSRSNPGNARVTLTALIPSLGKRVKLERSVKTPEILSIVPNDQSVLNVLAQVALHPEFALSRRELIRYVISAPGDRAKEVQTLLRLDRVEELRTSLQKVANACERQLKPLGAERTLARDQLTKKLDVPELSQKTILAAVNPRRILLGLSPIETLTATSLLTDGLATAPAGANAPPRIPKLHATNDINELRESLSKLTNAKSQLLAQTIKRNLEGLAHDPGLLNSVTREKLLLSALQLIENERCPVCDTELQPGELRQLIQTKLKQLEAMLKKKKEIEADIAVLSASIPNIKQMLLVVCRYCVLAKPPINSTELTKYASQLEASLLQLEAFFPVSSTITSLSSVTVTPSAVLSTIEEVVKAVKSIPEPTKQEAARDYLVGCQERFEAFQDVSRRFKRATEQSLLSKQIYNTYATISVSVLNSIYKQVEANFTDLYKFINHEDEGAFDARLIPSIGRLGFDVDFYGRGYFPPGAYHSEGHQDGMGLCLYLALMKHLLGEGFTFAVLDDVLMSVDSSHRREVCKLLREKFPSTQFILTTHDGIWLRHMKTAGLIKADSFIQFRRWDVDNGPTEWQDRDVWKEIETEVEGNNILVASSLLRNYLEYISGEVCHLLRAHVEYRGDAQFQLGDLLPNATGKFRKLLKEAKAAAQSWGQKDKVALIEQREANFAAVLAQTKVDEWQINPAIHYNQWANFVKEDFRSVVLSQRALVSSLRCDSCGSFFYVIPERGTSECLRCSCGATNFNIARK